MSNTHELERLLGLLKDALPEVRKLITSSRSFEAALDALKKSGTDPQKPVVPNGSEPIWVELPIKVDVVNLKPCSVRPELAHKSAYQGNNTLVKLKK